MRIVIAFVLSITLAGAACAQTCSNADLRGTYLFIPSGHSNLKDLNPGMPDLMAPWTGVGLIEYDGNGKAAGRFFGSFGGLPASFEFTEFKYAVNSDCTGTAEYKLQPLPAGPVIGLDKHKILVLDEGLTIRTIMTESPGRTTITTSALTRISHARAVCQPSMLRGSYLFHYDGWVNMQALNPNQPAYYAPALGVGFWTIDPDKGHAGGGTHNWGGVTAETEMLEHSLTVKSDCTVTGSTKARVKQTGQQSVEQYMGVVKPDGSAMYLLNGNVPAIYIMSRVAM